MATYILDVNYVDLAIKFGKKRALAKDLVILQKLNLGTG